MAGPSIGPRVLLVVPLAFGAAGCLLPRYEKRVDGGTMTETTGAGGSGGSGGAVDGAGIGGRGGTDGGGVDGTATGGRGGADGGVDGTGAAERPTPMVVDGGPGYCLSAEPDFSFLDGFESYPVESYVAAAPGSPWRVLNASINGGQVTSAWVRSCSQDLGIQSRTEVMYVPLQLSVRPSKLNIELLYAPENGATDSAEFGLASVNGVTLNKAFSVSGQGTNLVVTTPSGNPAQIAANLQSASTADLSVRPPKNYILVELDFCAQQARVSVGRDAMTTMTQTVDLGDTGPFNAFYFAGGVRSTYIDDLAIWTPGTSFDRDSLCASKLLETIPSPGGRCSGIGWDGTDLWMIDNLKSLWRIGDATPVPVPFQGYGLSWDTNGFWTRDTMGTSFGNEIVHLHPNGSVDFGPNIFAPQPQVSDSGAQAQFQSPDTFWVLSTTYDIVQKWSMVGTQVTNWQGPSGASGILLKGDALYFAVEIPRGVTSDPDTGIAKYSLQGTLIHTENVSQLGLPTFKNRYSLATDGTTYWICDESESSIYHIALDF